MIEFLKESTFAVNDVIQKAWYILKKHYFIIGSLCFLIFLTWYISGVMAVYFKSYSPILKVLPMIVFMVTFSGLQLTLFKYTLALLDEKNRLTAESLKLKTYQDIKLIFLLIGLAFGAALLFTVVALFSGLDLFYWLPPIVVVSCLISLFVFRKKLYPLVIVIRNYWPSKEQLANFLLSTVCLTVIMFLALLLIAVLFFPIVYLNQQKMSQVANAAITVGAVLALIAGIRISFFPLFIVDRGASAFKSLRLSLAITRGNFTRILLILFFVLICPFLAAAYFSSKDLRLLVLVVSLIYAFVIVPLFSVIIVVAYRQMTSEYKGDDDPDVIHNLL